MTAQQKRIQCVASKNVDSLKLVQYLIHRSVCERAFARSAFRSSSFSVCLPHYGALAAFKFYRCVFGCLPPHLLVIEKSSTYVTDLCTWYRSFIEANGACCPPSHICGFPFTLFYDIPRLNYTFYCSMNYIFCSLFLPLSSFVFIIFSWLTHNRRRWRWQNWRRRDYDIDTLWAIHIEQRALIIQSLMLDAHKVISSSKSLLEICEEKKLVVIISHPMVPVYEMKSKNTQ